MKTASDIDWAKEFPGIDFISVQKTIIAQDLPQTGIFLGTGVGKTLPSLVLGRGSILVVSPKQQKLDRTWQKNNEKFNLGKTITVMSKEEFRRDWETLPYYDTLIFDEGHNMLGVTPETRQRNKIEIPKTSQMFEAALRYVQKHKPGRFYIVTATPASKPMNVWAIAKLFGKNWDWYKFRSTFYFPVMIGRRQIWMPKKDDQSQDRLALAVRKLGYTGSLSDFLDVPEQTHITVEIPLSDEQKKALAQLQLEEADPLVVRSRMRTIENGLLYSKKIEAISATEDALVKETKFFKSDKIDYIIDRAAEFPKLFIFAAYTAQVFRIADALEAEGYTVKTVVGSTKDRGTVFTDMEDMKKGIVVVASQICEGYRVPSAPCMIFASKSNRFVHYDQGKGRILDGQHLKKNLYIHLVVPDGADEDCHNAIMSGQDFQEKLSVL